MLKRCMYMTVAILLIPVMLVVGIIYSIGFLLDRIVTFGLTVLKLFLIFIDDHVTRKL